MRDLPDPSASVLALCAVKGVSWSLIAREAQRPAGLDTLLSGRIVEQSTEADTARPLLADAADTFDARVARARDEITRAADAGAHLVTVLDDAYPLNLRLIPNLPPFLFYIGELRADDARAVAVVGTRDATDEGVKLARRVAKGLVLEGVTVLSGLAQGIDTAAHRATLENKGRTIAVMGTGILRVYPAENEELAAEIAKTGALVSQFWPTAPPAKYTFPRRNVVMSGMGQGTVVVEATHTSGAKMQARLALEHNKRVFLVADLVTKQPWARRYVEQRGAIEVENTEQIVAHLRSPEQIRDLSKRRQMILELAE